ncbi:helix-turn-helix transcriptional regulator [Paraburkholderia sp.]|uniref:helix-turn-helix transcriptional regulator n=1 Tax=Paraburkholderia sp. TaxID=1926495 RepID=UPI003D6F87CE
MTVNTLPTLPTTQTLSDPVASLGDFLRDRRSRLQPDADAPSRRRTPGLRREEVATRANISVAWYTWLEQGRGGPPSVEVLERLARALELDAAAREMLFLLAQQRPPPLNPAAPLATGPVVTSALQRVLDGLTATPAVARTPIWDVVAWNAAAMAVLGDYTGIQPSERNVLRRIFGTRNPRERWPDWEADARFALASFRVDVARIGGSEEAVALAAELQATSADFRRLWAENEVRSAWVGHKHIQHPVAGSLTLEYSTFAVGGSTGLSMAVFTPVTPADAKAIEMLLARGTRVT